MGSTAENPNLIDDEQDKEKLLPLPTFQQPQSPRDQPNPR